MRIIIIIIFLAINLLSYSQTNQQLTLIQNSLGPSEQTKVDYSQIADHSNEVEFFTAYMFLFYKSFVSSQDASSCSFTPSCSVYAVQAIKTQGLLLGLINFFDRFSRCNTLSPEDYNIDEESHLLIDPVRNFSYHTTYEE